VLTSVRTLAVLSFLWLILCGISIWLILKNTQSIGLVLLSVLALSVLGFLAATLGPAPLAAFDTGTQERGLPGQLAISGGRSTLPRKAVSQEPSVAKWSC
jgi:hypothetical protein